jgi:hypothetical protein
LWIELELSGLDLRQIEHLVDEAEQVGAGAVHALQWLLRLSTPDRSLPSSIL